MERGELAKTLGVAESDVETAARRLHDLLSLGRRNTSAVTVEYHRDNGLDGKVSCIKFGQ